MRDAPIARHAEEIRRTARCHGVVRLRVFGPRATGTAAGGSDLDLLADFEPGRSLLDLIGLKQELEDLLGLKVDVLTEDGLSPYLRDGIPRSARDL